MAEFLINKCTMKIVDREFGDIIVVKPKDWKWSESERSNIVCLPNLKYKDCLHYMVSDYELYLKCIPQLFDFFTIKELKVMIKEEKKEKLKEKKEKIKYYFIDQVTFKEKDKILIKHRFFLKTDYEPFYAKMDDDSTIQLIGIPEYKIFNYRRFKILKGEIVDKCASL